MDSAGNLYGTASDGGVGHGTVYKLARHGSSWLFLPLYSFQGIQDGAIPMSAITIGPDGSLYGTTESGGHPGDCNGLGCGIVYRLRPQAHPPGSLFVPWTETILHRFSLTGGDGFYPYSEVLFDAAGNMYGTASDDNQLGLCSDGKPCGGCDTCGIVYELSPSGGDWNEQILYRIPNWEAGAFPAAGLVFDQSGNLYGTTASGGNCGYGTAFELSPGVSWTVQTLVHFCGGAQGADPSGGLLFTSGTLYGGTPGAPLGFGDVGGSIFTLQQSNGTWSFTSLFSFSGFGTGPQSTLSMDPAGDLYGTTAIGGITGGPCGSNGCGTIFKLTPNLGVWTYSTVYEFTGGADGYAPHSKVAIDASGNLYGTASLGGASGKGTVWQITP